MIFLSPTVVISNFIGGGDSLEQPAPSPLQVAMFFNRILIGAGHEYLLGQAGQGLLALLTGCSRRCGMVSRGNAVLRDLFRRVFPRDPLKTAPARPPCHLQVYRLQRWFKCPDCERWLQAWWNTSGPSSSSMCSFYRKPDAALASTLARSKRGNVPLRRIAGCRQFGIRGCEVGCAIVCRSHAQ